jgi:hypothetical protein
MCSRPRFGAGSSGERSTRGSGRGSRATCRLSCRPCVSRTPELRRANEILKTASGIFRGGGARPQTGLIVAYIDAYKDRFGVEPICRVLSEHDVPIAPSTYHAHRSRPVPDSAHMANTLVDLERANRSLYGADKCWTAMRAASHDIGRDQAARLMRILGIECVRRGKHHTKTTIRDPQGGPPSGSSRTGLERPDPAGSVVVRGLHLRVDPSRVLLHQLSHRRVLQEDPGLAGLDLQGDPVGHVRPNASTTRPNPRSG